MWKIEINAAECPELLIEDGKLFCLSADSESQYCQEKTCPLRIEESSE